MTLSDFLHRSSAGADFRAAVALFVASGRPNERISFSISAPPVKVERALTKLLESSPDLEIERVEIRGSSGCEFFRGEMTVVTTTDLRTIQFHWDCKWKAQQEGWTDCFGFADQVRAARVFGYDCFRRWTVAEVEALNQPLLVGM